MYVYYTLEVLRNKQAAKSILVDAKGAQKRLSVIADSLKKCDDPILAEHEYRKIRFEKHKFIMIYRIEEGQVIVDGKENFKRAQ